MNQNQQVDQLILQRQIRQFVEAWYTMLDSHAPAEECWRMLAAEGLSMHFPDSEITDLDSFKKWYYPVIYRFFDETHTVKSVQLKSDAEPWELTVVVGLQASWWEYPAAQSRRVSLDATQAWTIRSSTKNTYGFEIVSYTAMAEPFQYAPGLASLNQVIASDQPIEAEIIQLNELILNYEETGDAEHLRPLLAEGFSIRRSSGVTHDRQKFLEEAPKNAHLGRKAEQPQVLRVGNCVLYTCFVTTTHKPDGTASPGRFWNARVFIQDSGEWRCAAWQVVRIQ